MIERIDIDRNWLRKENEEELMRRLHNITSGTGRGPFKKDTGFPWQLDESNDYWAEVEDGKLVLGCRYSGERAHAFVAFCKIWLA